MTNKRKVKNTLLYSILLTSTLIASTVFATETKSVVTDSKKLFCLRPMSDTVLIDLETLKFGYQENVSSKEMDPKRTFDITDLEINKETDSMTFSINNSLKFKLESGQGGRDGVGIKLRSLDNSYDKDYSCNKME